MIIPKELTEREPFLQEVIQICESSMADRLAVNNTLRDYALFGTNQPGGVKYNKILPTLNLLSSFLYGQEGIKFSVKFGIGTPKEQFSYGNVMQAKAHELWDDTGTNKRFGQGVFWSLVYGSYILKTIYSGSLHTYSVLPHMIGVYREDVATIDDQEAILHTYHTTKSGLRTQTKILGPEKQTKILEKVATLGPVDESMAPATLTQIIAKGQIGMPGGVTGNVERGDPRYNYRPQISPELVEMKEVWVWDDELEDYRVFTIANPNVVIFDRPGGDLCHKSEHPFTKITPYEIENYFWGRSMVQDLMGLQDWHEGHTQRIDDVFRKQLRPPRAMTGPGWGNLTDERMLALDRPGGFINSNVPGAKVDFYPPSVDIAQALAYLKDIDAKFDEMAGIGGNIMRAQGDEGVRSMQHAQVLARMGSAPIKKTALAIEDPAEKQITLMMKMQQDHDKAKYLDDDNKEFLLSQVTDNYSIKVSGHSLSPVFVEDTKAEAKALVGMKAMTRKRYLQQTQPPMEQELERDLEKIEEGEAKQAQVKAGLELVKATKGKIV